MTDGTITEDVAAVVFIQFWIAFMCCWALIVSAIVIVAGRKCPDVPKTQSMGSRRLRLKVKRR